MTTRRVTPTPYTRRDAFRGFLLRLGLYGSLGIAAWGHWWHAVRP